MVDAYKHILITGGTGFIGSHLVALLLKQGHYITILTRNPDKYSEDAKNLTYTGWDESILDQVGKADVIINLAGENIFGQRWTDEVKRRLLNSRVDTTQQLTKAIMETKSKPDVFISGSAVGYYGDCDKTPLKEDYPAGSDFLAEVCKAWEDAAQPVEQTGTRLVFARIGIVLEEDGGALENMIPAFKLFAGGPVGSGNQFVPWIHMLDLCNAFLFLINNNNLKGPFNICAPNPVTMNDFAEAVGNALNRPSFFRVPEFMLNLALGEAATPILSSLNAQPQKLIDAGFNFEFEDIKVAINDVIS